MTLAWAVQRMTASSGWIDTIWSLAVGLGGAVAVLLADGDFLRHTVLFCLVVLWALRLGGHIGSRTRLGGEDPRYAKLIEDWGDRAAVRLLLFLQVQAAAAFILVASVYLAAANSLPFPSVTDIVGILIAAVAIVGETISDAQLASFRKTPQARTEVCEKGLWRYSRHPNYFFEWLFWCAMPILAIGGGAWGLLALLAPLQMYWLLVHVSGIPPLEEHMLRSRGDKFRDLQACVNAFFPGPRHQGESK